MDIPNPWQFRGGKAWETHLEVVSKWKPCRKHTWRRFRTPVGTQGKPAATFSHFSVASGTVVFVDSGLGGRMGKALFFPRAMQRA